MIPEPHRTIDAVCRHEPPKIKGSRHIASAAPAATEADVETFVREIRAEMPDAVHHAYAWRLGRGRDHFRYSDDGEPSGSAGQPILRQIDGHDLTDIVVVVSRYFGGTKLGVGGLVRAYGGAAAELLDRAPVISVVPSKRMRLHHEWGDSGAIAGILSEYGLSPTDSSFTDRVALELLVPEHLVDELASVVRDRTAARARLVDA